MNNNTYIRYQCDFCKEYLTEETKVCPKCMKSVDCSVSDYKFITPKEIWSRFITETTPEKTIIPSIRKEEKKGFWYYVIGVLFIIGFIWMIISGSNDNRYGCYEDKYGNETCNFDPRN